MQIAVDFFNSSRISYFLTLPILLLAVWHAVPLYQFMATSSLWQDELVTVEFFSSLGWHNAVTNYGAPNNHVFFNFINALTPQGENPFLPGRARLWSFLATTAALGALYGCFARNRHWWAGAFIVWWAVLNQGLLQLCLQARGYGFTFLAAALSCWLAQNYLRSTSKPWPSMLALGLITALGTYSVPTYLAFGGGMMLVFLIISRDWRWIVIGVATLLLVFLLYLPVLEQMRTNAADYSNRWGEQYASLLAVRDTVNNYLLNGQAKSMTVLLLFPSLLAALYFGPGKRDETTRASLVVLGASLIFLACCLVIKTPLVRTTAFVAAPLLFASVAAAQRLLALLPQRLRIPWLALLLLAAIGTTTLFVRSTRRFRPIDSWLETARKIEKTFPQGTAIWQYPPKRQHINKYVSSDYPTVQAFDKNAFLEGKLIVVDAKCRQNDPKLSADFFPPETRVIETRQRHSKMTVYYFPQ